MNDIEAEGVMEADCGATASALPVDWSAGTFLGRLATADGPSPVLLVRGELLDMARVAPTVSELVERGDFTGAGGTSLGPLKPLQSYRPGPSRRRAAR